MKRFFTYILLFLIYGTTFLHGGNVQSGQINQSGYFIQIGAFTNRDNVKRLQQRLDQYDTYTEQFNQYTRVYVVNISDKNVLNKTLQNLRIEFPQAFIAKKPSIVTASAPTPDKSIAGEVSDEDVAEGVLYLPQEPNPKTQTIIEVEKEEEGKEGGLNSQSIIKTRKTFL